MPDDLVFLAGQRAYERIRDGGLAPDDVAMVVGASGAAKWLVLHGLESAVFGTWFSGRAQALHLFGTSIGAWKSAAAAQNHPIDGLNRLAHAYIHQEYEGRITANQIVREVDRMTAAFLPAGTPAEILNNPYCRLHFSAVRSRGLLASDKPIAETAGLALAWLANRMSRGLLRRLCPPTLFYDSRTPPPFLRDGEFSGGSVPLSENNLRQALLASGSIPRVMKSLRCIPGARSGSYRDGGVFHYHPAFDFLAGREGIVLYPHFYERVTLGWFDKKRRHRIADGHRLCDTLLVCPSASFIAGLPYGRIPDRHDFERFSGHDVELIAFWEQTVAMGRRLGEQFLEAAVTGRIRGLVQRIPHPALP